MSNKFKNVITSFGMNVVVNHKIIVLILLIALVVISVMGAQNLRLDSSDEQFFPENSVTFQKYDRFKEIFGNEDYIFLLVESDNVFNYNTLKYIRKLTRDLEENLPFVDEVTSLANIEYLEAADNNIDVGKLIGDKIPEDKEELNFLRKKALAQRSYVGSIITEDAKSTGVIIEFKEIPKVAYADVPENFNPLQQENWSPKKRLMKDDIYYEQDDGLNEIPDPLKLITPALKTIMVRNQVDDVNTYVTGSPIFSYESDLIASEEGAKFGLIALIAAVVLMFFLFRNLRAIISTFFVILFTMLILFGFLGWFNIELSMLVIIVPTLILVISVSYSIHYINHFLFSFRNKGDRLKAVKYAYQEASWPIFITAITTALGFCSFLLLEMPPLKVIGFSCALGVLLAYFLVMTVTPIIFSVGKNKDISQEEEKKEFNSKMNSWADIIAANINKIVVLTIILLVLLVGFSFKMPVNPDMLEMIGDKVEVVKDTRHIIQRLGSPYSYEVMIELPQEEMAKKSKFLKNINNLSDQISSSNNVVRVSALTDVIKNINVAMHQNNQDYYTIPDSNELVSQYLFLYEMSGGEGIDEWVNFSYDKARVSVQVKDLGGKLNAQFEEIHRFANKHFPAETKVTIVGRVPITLKMMEYVSEGQIKSILGALIIITLIMIFVLKSLKLGLISMIPNVIPILAITGTMGIVGISLNHFTLIVAPMIIGIAVDDTVHYFVHFKEEYLETNSYFKSNKLTFKKIGRALIFTSVVLMLGYGIFTISKMQAFAEVAILSVVGIFVALVADMFLTPAIIIFLKPFGRSDVRADREVLNDDKQI